MSLRKQWRWVGAFGPRVMLCAAWAAVGPARVSWWAVWDRERRELVERHRRSWRGVAVGRDRVVVPGVMDLSLSRGRAIEVQTGRIWTRKTPVLVAGQALGLPVACDGLLDESAGRHPRRTAWLWTAGVGVATSGAAVTWNLVEGMHEREPTVWLDGEPHPVPGPPFDGLAGVGGLRFDAEAVRARRENLLVVSSDYEQPFGTFAGSLPVAGELREGWGVMERHEARW